MLVLALMLVLLLVLVRVLGQDEMGCKRGRAGQG